MKGITTVYNYYTAGSTLDKIVDRPPDQLLEREGLPGTFGVRRVSYKSSQF